MDMFLIVKYLGNPQSGSQAQTTASRNRFGQYYRTRATPTQPRSDSQVFVRTALATTSQLWRLLTQDQRNAWATYAASHPRVDSLGQTKILTGHQMYVALNQLPQVLGLAIVSDPPEDEDQSIPAVTDSTHQPDDVQLEIAASDPIVNCVMFAGKPTSPGRTFCANYFLIGNTLTDDTDPTDFQLAPLLTAKFGTLAVGQRIFLRWVFTNLVGVPSWGEGKMVLDLA